MLIARGTTFGVRLSATNTHRPTLEHLASLTGVGAVIWRKLHHLRNPKLHKLAGQWAANAEAAESVLRQALPYFVTKREQAELALDAQQRFRDPSLKADRVWQHDYLARMKDLNRRGPGM